MGRLGSRGIATDVLNNGDFDGDFDGDLDGDLDDAFTCALKFWEAVSRVEKSTFSEK